MVCNKQNHILISIRQSDGSKFYSSSKGELPILQNLPLAVRVAHGFQNIKTNLLSIEQLCDHRCVAMFDKEKCILKHDNKKILEGKRSKVIGL